MKNKLITYLCLAAFCLAGTNSAFANVSSDPAMVVADAVIVRPVCLVATIVGSAFFVVALPFAATSKTVKSTAHTLVVMPARATFTRPMGDIDMLVDY